MTIYEYQSRLKHLTTEQEYQTICNQTILTDMRDRLNACMTDLIGADSDSERLQAMQECYTDVMWLSERFKQLKPIE